MEYGVDFNRIRKLQSVGVGGDNLFNLIRASVLLIKFLSRLFYIQISYIQLDKVTNLVGRYQGLFLIYCSFIDRLGLYYFVSKELLQFLYLLYKFVYFYDLQGVVSGVRDIAKGFKTYSQILAVVGQERGDFYSF